MASVALALGLGKIVLPAHMQAWIEGNRAVVFGAAFVCNMIAGQLRQTGAFELYLDDQLVFSKLQSGGIPPFDHLLSLVTKAIANSKSK